MNPNQTPAQVPPTQQVPDQRLEQIQENMRLLEQQNSQLRQQIDFLAKASKGPAPVGPAKESPFKPEVQQALKDMISEAITGQIQPMQEKFQQNVGYLMDRNDQIDFQVKYGGEKYKTYLPKVETLRKQYEMQGQWIPREEALRKIYFDDAGTKPHPDPVAQNLTPTPKAPVYDPYFQTYVDPDTRRPVAPGMNTPLPVETQPDPTQAPQQAPMWQTPQAPQPPAHTVGIQSPGSVRPGGQGPFQNPYGVPTQQFNLPGQGVSPQGQGPKVDARKLVLDLNSSDADLAAFEEQHGDIPL